MKSLWTIEKSSTGWCDMLGGELIVSMTLRSSSVAPGERIEWWADCVQDRFGAEYRIDHGKRDAFFVDATFEFSPSMMLLAMHAGAHHAIGRRDPAQPSVLVHLQVDGNLRLRAEGTEVLLKPGDLCLFPVRETTDLCFESEYRQVAVVMPEESLDDAFPIWRRFVANAIPSGKGMAAVLADHLQSLARHPDVFGGPCASTMGSVTTGLIAASLGTLNRASIPESRGLIDFHRERILQFVRLNLCNPVLNIDYVARGVGLSARYLHKLFRGKPLMQLVQRERLESCYRLLAAADSRTSTCEIAYASGFNDHAHFTRSFRRRFGVSPREIKGTAAALQGRG